jgi:HPt (histidine-containing phosphotransfer) domain-containing protein
MPVKETPLVSEVFDQLRHAMAADPAGLTELYRDYLTDAWQSLQILWDSVNQKQSEDMRARAHYLKSSSLVLGAPTVARCAGMLEELANEPEVQDASGVLENTKRALQEVQAELLERLGASVIPAGQTAA